jgi:hypothetical protein
MMHTGTLDVVFLRYKKSAAITIAALLLLCAGCADRSAGPDESAAAEEASRLPFYLTERALAAEEVPAEPEAPAAIAVAWSVDATGCTPYLDGGRFTRIYRYPHRPWR